MTALAIEGGAPAVDLAPPRLWPFYSAAVRSVVDGIVESGDVSATRKHPLIEEFETRFAVLHCPGGLGLFCGSGTAALFAGYFALGLEPGAEVLVPTQTFRATVTPLLLLNLRPVLCDVDQTTRGIDLQDAERRITNRTRALVVTHLWGHPADMDAVSTFAHRYGLRLVEDCSHAHGTTWRSRPVGSFGDFAAFSVGTKKMVSGGTAGVLLTRKREVYERALLLGHPKARLLQEITDESLLPYVATGLGANLRGTPIAAALALDHLDRLPETIAIKTANLDRLASAIQRFLPALKLPQRSPAFTAGGWYSYRCEWSHPRISRTTLVRALQAEGVAVKSAGPPLHRQPLFANPAPLTTQRFEPLPLADPDGYPQADQLAETIVSWDTTEFYDPAAELVDRYAAAFEKVAVASERLERAQLAVR